MRALFFAAARTKRPHLDPGSAELANDYLLTASGALPAGLEEQLRKVAQDYSEELFEFEGTATEVAVYWSEWGGPDKVRRLHYHLERLASY